MTTPYQERANQLAWCRAARFLAREFTGDETRADELQSSFFAQAREDLRHLFDDNGQPITDVAVLKARRAAMP